MEDTAPAHPNTEECSLTKDWSVVITNYHNYCEAPLANISQVKRCKEEHSYLGGGLGQVLELGKVLGPVR